MQLLNSFLLAVPLPGSTGKIIAIVIGLILLWVVLKIVLRFALKIFSCGCAVIVLIGLIMFASSFFSASAH